MKPDRQDVFPGDQFSGHPLDAVTQARNALAAWDRYQPNVCRADTIEQAVAMASAIRRLLSEGGQ